MAHLRILVFLLISAVMLDKTTGQSTRSKPAKPKKAKEDEGDLRAQINKLWQEVNSLKEMQALQTVCLRGTKVHKKCYLASNASKHFHEANEDCIARGGTLAIPRDMDENNALRDYGKKSLPGVSDLWIGINDMMKEGKFVDINGMTLNFFNWDRSQKQPNGGKRENCAMLSQSTQGKWLDDVCRSVKRYICEFLIP
ncbi:tetranectin-like protein [Latimeria chalumnae]|uniref:tetranectin-like protein n=1 Tax=Latimeria chalumnae TaxID=7897 RepID=UPI0003C174C3|nr:PREDICTED: C-type lectin domain family 3 member A [Latimeria chalumnae]|eukprot:XP_006007608.1 PREDICTED: C-type lectin domain family 3 member A [Latimeria chalumnae]